MEGLLDDLDKTQTDAAMNAIRATIRTDDHGLEAQITGNRKLADEDRAGIIEAARKAIAERARADDADA
jgi:hypothetical protein